MSFFGGEDFLEASSPLPFSTDDGNDGTGVISAFSEMDSTAVGVDVDSLILKGC